MEFPISKRNVRFSRVIGGFRRGDGGFLLRGELDAKLGAFVRVRGPHVSRDLSSLLRDRRHVSDESQVSESGFHYFQLTKKFINPVLLHISE